MRKTLFLLAILSLICSVAVSVRAQNSGNAGVYPHQKVLQSAATSTPLSTPTTQVPSVPSQQSPSLSGLVNAIGAYDSNPWGTKADIETADPQIRDGGWSFARAAVQYSPPGTSTNYFAEIGWYKDSSGVISIHVTSQSPDGPFNRNYDYFPSPGSTHNYQVLWNSGQQGYDLFYDNILITNRPASLTLTRVFSGGEASSSANAIGIAGCFNNQYATSSSGSWVNYPSHYNQVESGYFVFDLSANSWQVSGNN